MIITVYTIVGEPVVIGPVTREDIQSKDNLDFFMTLAEEFPSYKHFNLNYGGVVYSFNPAHVVKVTVSDLDDVKDWIK